MSDSSWIRIGAIEAHLDARTINGEIKEILGHRAESITHDPDLRALIGTYFVNQVTPYVPKKTGKLRESGRGTEDGRVYWSATSPKGFNYALTQYETQYTHYTTPGTGPYWIDPLVPGTRAWDEFIDRIAPAVRRRFEDG